MADQRQPLPPSLWDVVALRATGARWPPETQSRAELVARACLDEGLLPLLQAEPALPLLVRDAVRRAMASRLHVDRDHALRRGLRRALELIGSEVVVLKGSDFAHRLYVDPALRPMFDVDLLVPLARAAEVRAHLEYAGAAPIFHGPATRVSSYSGCVRRSEFQRACPTSLQVLTTSRCSQVEKSDWPRYCPMR